VSLDSVGQPALGGRTLVLGGSASGKSALAEHLLAGRPDVVYTATGPVVDLRAHPDAEWAGRVSRHRERRPTWWQTEETHEVASLLAKLDQPVLLDSIGTWLAGVLDRAGAWQDRTGWRDRLTAETDLLVRAWRARRTPLVAVTDEVGWGVVPATASGRLFRDELGRLNRRLAGESERVLLVVAGRLLTDVQPGPR
jgi:adenosylcobinamide kinase / adenosylcobinamide-phosphate guanylyltransferase